jgi:glutamine synthetase
MDLGARTLPQLPRHSGDRNRTSPFAFTGNKFEFRAVGSSASIAWPNTVLNTIVAESLDYVATELEKGVGARRTEQKLQQVTLALLKRLLKEHKRVLFNGDNYSSEWHAEAARRGLPNYKNSTAVFPVLKSRKTVDIFKKYGVLSKAEVDSRYHIEVEKYIKQLGIEAETMVGIARSLVLPAAVRHLTVLAQAAAATKSAGLESDESIQAAEEFNGLVNELRRRAAELDRVSSNHDGEPLKHAAHINDVVKPAMAALRETVDTLESHVSADLWPLPTYRQLLFLK